MPKVKIKIEGHIADNVICNHYDYGVKCCRGNYQMFKKGANVVNIKTNEVRRF